MSFKELRPLPRSMKSPGKDLKFLLWLIREGGEFSYFGDKYCVTLEQSEDSARTFVRVTSNTTWQLECSTKIETLPETSATTSFDFDLKIQGDLLNELIEFAEGRGLSMCLSQEPIESEGGYLFMSTQKTVIIFYEIINFQWLVTMKLEEIREGLEGILGTGSFGRIQKAHASQTTDKALHGAI